MPRSSCNSGLIELRGARRGAGIGEEKMECPECGSQLFEGGMSETLVAYVRAHFTDEKGRHNHDDNCRIYSYYCANGNHVSERRQNFCPVCDWKGKAECFCHPLGVKVRTAR
jgi:RNA polymerase subunit RPABC4/transcription elongation factor Spt4